MDSGLSTGDLALMDRNNNDWGGGAFMWIFALLILANGFNGFGGGRFNNAIGYENLATSNEVQRGFDNQNAMANQREILAAVTNGTAQSIAATNQTFHDTVGILSDKYGEIQRDIANLQLAQQQGIANQNQCCCDTKMMIADSTNGINAAIAQARYDSAMNTASINNNLAAQTQKILDAMSQNKIEALQNRVNALELQAATANVVRYPSGWTYNAGNNPFCGGTNCGCGCANI